jgi:hypothetical protein
VQANAIGTCISCTYSTGRNQLCLAHKAGCKTHGRPALLKASLAVGCLTPLSDVDSSHVLPPALQLCSSLAVQSFVCLSVSPSVRPSVCLPARLLADFVWRASRWPTPPATLHFCPSTFESSARSAYIGLYERHIELQADASWLPGQTLHGSLWRLQAQSAC